MGAIVIILFVFGGLVSLIGWTYVFPPIDSVTLIMVTCEGAPGDRLPYW